MEIERYSRARRWGIWVAALAAGVLHTVGEAGIYQLSISTRLAASLLEIGLVWLIIVALAVLASREATVLTGLLGSKERDRREALARLERLDAQNAVLRAIAEAAEVSLALVPMSRHIRSLVFCDQVGLALPRGDGQVFGTFSARVDQEERRARPRLELEFRAASSLIGSVVARGAPRLVPNLVELGPDLLDANFWVSSGFRSAAIVPLVAQGRAFGALFVTARRPDAFQPAALAALAPLADVLGVAYTAQQLQVAVARQQTATAMAEETLAGAADMRSALQTIIGRCDLLEHEYPDPALQRDLAIVVRQAQRLEAILDGIRQRTEARLRETARSAAEAVPSGPPADSGPA